jgi:hypothetical protein
MPHVYPVQPFVEHASAKKNGGPYRTLSSSLSNPMLQLSKNVNTPKSWINAVICT